MEFVLNEYHRNTPDEELCGETVMENLQTLCSDCNLGKIDLVIE